VAREPVPRDRSAISDLEVNYEEVDGKLYGVRYPFAGRPGGPNPDGNDYVQLTTRPETLLGDRCSGSVPRMMMGYAGPFGRRVMFVGREVEMLSHSYADPVFGPVFEVTPVTTERLRDQRHCSAVNVRNPDGTINENGVARSRG